MLYETILFFVGPFAVAYAIVTTTGTAANLEKVLKHFLNYAALAILGVLLVFWNQQLERRGPEDPLAWISLFAFTFIGVLAGGLALANYWFGIRTIAETFEKASHAGLKTWLLCILYTLLLLNVFFFWRYGDNPFSK